MVGETGHDRWQLLSDELDLTHDVSVAWCGVVWRAVLWCAVHCMGSVMKVQCVMCG